MAKFTRNTLQNNNMMIFQIILFLVVALLFILRFPDLIGGFIFISCAIIVIIVLARNANQYIQS